MTVGHFISIRAEDTLSTTHNKSPMYILSPSNNRLLKSIVATKIFEPLPAQNVPGRSVPSLLGNIFVRSVNQNDLTRNKNYSYIYNYIYEVEGQLLRRPHVRMEN